MSELESQFVKRGYWVNYAQGPVMGQTITTDSRSGALVIALLAVITSLGLTHLWHLLTFFCYQVRADGVPNDGLFRQQQALLRTLPTPSTFSADLIKLWFAWRKVSQKAFLRSSLGVSIAVLYIMVSLVVSIFSSYVVSSLNLEVLVSSPHCGMLDPEAWWTSYGSTIRAATESYGPECYRSNGLPSRCNIYTRPNIPFTTESIPCPFDERMCTVPAVAFDSGLIDMRDTFGINLEEKDRVQYRKRTSCAILPLDGHTRVADTSSMAVLKAGRPALPNETYLLYTYGQNPYEGPEGFTFGHSLFYSNITTRIDHVRMKQYAPTNTTADMETFQVDRDLQRWDADVSLRLTLKNAVQYENPVDDPMFSAHRETIFTDGTTGENITMYMSDHPGSVMGCAEQYQYCLGTSSSGHSCINLGGSSVLLSNILPEATEVQRAIIGLVGYYMMLLDISQPGRYKSQEELSSSQGVISTLPSDQWIQELQSWESIVWAAHQVILADYAVGPAMRDPLSESIVLPPKKSIEKKLCGMQKMRKPGGFVNINVFGLVFTITICSSITLADLLLLRSLILWRKLKKSAAPRLDRWIQDGVYQLQRRAYEASGNGDWDNLADEVPVTREPTKLPDLQIETSPTCIPRKR